MRMVCVYTPQYKESTAAARHCVTSAKEFGYDVELYESVFWKDMDKVHENLNLTKKYKPTIHSSKLTATKCPATRMANGTTHYLLYLWSIKHDEPICIVEHDSVFVGKIPDPIENGVIQISSHYGKQLTSKILERCSRAIKMRKFQPDFKYVWPKGHGVVRHPLTGMNGTSGYIIGPKAAAKMVEYVQRDGIAFADRLRTEHIGEGNLWLQKPQSVLCFHNKIKSHVVARTTEGY